MPRPLDFLEEEIAGLRAGGLLRESSPGCTDDLLNLCSNDYLGYAALEFDGAGRSGAGASRLVFGDAAEHHVAEAALAAWVGLPSALLFSSGYAANLGVLQALAGAGDVIVSDALNHASIIDGCRLSRATVVVVPHADVIAVQSALRSHAGARRLFVITESVFSMDGDVPDLVGLREVCDAAGAVLIVDEAHALGVLGPSGAGACAQAGIVADVVVSGCGKGLGLQGAFVAGPVSLRAWLWNRARSFVFSTGVSPALARAVTARVGRARADDAGRRRLFETSADLGGALASSGFRGLGRSPILPVVLGSVAEASAAALGLRALGILVRAIHPPTVAPGSSRLRLTARASLAPAEVEFACRALRASLGGPRCRFT